MTEYRGEILDFTHSWAIVAILVLHLAMIYGLDVYEFYDFWATSPF